jgi:ATP-dependent Clp protease ATP-binding subunit ClpC
VAKIITEKTEVPVGEIETKERDILLNLEGLIHQRIINQEEAVKEVSQAMRRARSEITKASRSPPPSFLPTSTTQLKETTKSTLRRTPGATATTLFAGISKILGGRT